MTDWDDRIIDEHSKRIKEMRYMAATHLKFGLYKNPAFKFWHSMGLWDIFQGFKNGDIDLGVFHFYWDKNAENTIEYYDPKTGERTNNIKGDWRERWYDPGEKLEPVSKDPRDPVKMHEFWKREVIDKQEQLRWKQMQKMEEESDHEEIKQALKPYWEN